MAVNSQHVQDFFELRAGLMGMLGFAEQMRDYVEAALGFMDKNGIAAQGRVARTTGRPSTRKKAVPIAAIREEVKRRYTQRGTTKSAPLRGKARLHKQRQQSADVLAQLDPVEPRKVMHPKARGLGSLVRRGYIKRKGDGYIRTAKPFIVDKPSHSSGNGHSADDGAALTMTQAAKVLKMSDSNVRLLIKGKKLAGRTELRVRKGMKKAVPMMVIDREEVARYAAAEAAAQ